VVIIPKYPVKMTVLSSGGASRGLMTPFSIRRPQETPHSLHLSCDGVGTSMRHCIVNLASSLRRIGIDASASIGGPDDDRLTIGPTKMRDPWISIRWNVDTESQASGWASRRVLLDVADTWSWATGDRVDRMNSTADMLILPATSDVHEFKAAGVDIPISIVPFGVDSEVYHPTTPDWSIIASAEWNVVPPPGTHVFLVAGMLNARKGVDVALEAFRLAFGPDDPVAFLVKNSLRGNGTSQANLISTKNDGMMVGLLEEHIDEATMCVLLSTVDTFVSCHHREGFGLMPLQAMACGTVPILTAWDGPLSYATSRNSILVPPSRIVKTDAILGFSDGVDWAEIDPSDVARAMRKMFSDDVEDLRTNAIETGRAWSWEASATMMVEAIESRLARVSRIDGVPPSDV